MGLLDLDHRFRLIARNPWSTSASRGEATMTADTFHPSFAPKIFDRIPAMGMPRLVSILDFVKYAAVFAAYIAIFVVSFMTVGFLEIRQANMQDFNALIAVLEQRDGYADSHLDKALERLRQEIGSYALTLDIRLPGRGRSRSIQR